MWKCGYRYLSCEKLHKICQLVPTLQIREQLVNICFFSAVSCSFLNASIHFLWTLNYAMTEYRVILLTANFSIWRSVDWPFPLSIQAPKSRAFGPSVQPYIWMLLQFSPHIAIHTPQFFSLGPHAFQMKFRS